MQTIPIDSRVMVAHKFRHVAENDDAFWTGIVADTDDDEDGEQLCLVKFDEENEWWHAATTLTVLS